MSIVSEIQRLDNAKESIRTEMTKRGLAVSDSEKLDAYGGVLASYPYVTRGSFTPEEDTENFVISGLCYSPVAVCVACEELIDVKVASSIIYALAYKGHAGTIHYVSPSSEKQLANVYHKSSIISFEDNAVSVNIPSAETQGYFKKGYTYDFVVTGGFQQ